MEVRMNRDVTHNLKCVDIYCTLKCTYSISIPRADNYIMTFVAWIFPLILIGCVNWGEPEQAPH